MSKAKLKFDVDAEGAYYILFRHQSNGDMWRLDDDIFDTYREAEHFVMKNYDLDIYEVEIVRRCGRRCGRRSVSMTFDGNDDNLTGY